MTLGEALLVGALLASLAAALCAWRSPRWLPLALRAHAGLVAGAFGILVLAFLVGDLSIAYVWSHTRASYPWWYRLAGAWGGEEGTLLLWSAVVALTLVPISRRAGVDGLHRRAALAILAASTTLAFFSWRLGTFAPTGALDLASAPNGRGLAAVLLTPLMVIHPPVQFVAYGLVTVPAAYAVAMALGGSHDQQWARAAFPWARLAWLFATLGLGLGALWAYYVLSFGGYWVWDPVETGNLLPWLALTAFLHAGKQRLRGEGHVLAAPALAYLALVLTLFATFSTRSGLWVSVHAFTDPTDRFEPDAPARLLAILDAHPPTRLLLGALAAALFAGPALLALHHRERLGGARRYAEAHAVLLLALAGAAALAPIPTWGALLQIATLATPVHVGLPILLGLLLGAPLALVYLAEDEPDRPRGLTQRLLMATAVMLFTVALGVTLALDLQVVNGGQRAIFDQRAPFLALPIVLALTVALALGPLGRTRALALAGAGFAAGIVAYFLVPDARVVALASPMLAAAALAALVKIVHVQGTSAPRRMRAAGAALLALGIAGVFLWGNPPTYALGRAIPHGASVAMGVAGLLVSAALVVAGVACFRPAPRALSALGARVRETGIYLVHLALALGLLGIAASTYSAEGETFGAVPLDATLAVGERAFSLGPAQVETSGGRVDAVRIPVAISDAGQDAGSTSLDFVWDPEALSYTGRLEVRRAPAEDVYLTPLAFHTDAGWVGASSATGGRIDAAEVDAVTFGAKALPLMGLVWGGLWMMILGMLLILSGARLAERPR